MLYTVRQLVYASVVIVGIFYNSKYTWFTPYLTSRCQWRTYVVLFMLTRRSIWRNVHSRRRSRPARPW